MAWACVALGTDEFKKANATISSLPPQRWPALGHDRGELEWWWLARSGWRPIRYLVTRAELTESGGPMH